MVTPVSTSNACWTRRCALAVLGATGLSAVAGCVHGDFGADDSGLDDAGQDDAGEAIDEVDPDLHLNGTALTSSFPLRIYEVDTEAIFLEYHWHEDWSHWHLDPLVLEVDEVITTRVVVLDHRLEPLPLGPDERFQLTVQPVEPAVFDSIDVSIDRDIVTFHGLAVGQGEMIISIEADDEVRWSATPLYAEVRE